MANIYTVGQQPHTTFTYDLNGNMHTQTDGSSTATLDYDYENRLVKITYPDGGWTDFVYDALGRRLKAVEKNSQGSTTSEKHYVYDGLDLIADLNANNALQASYTHGPGIDDPLIVRYAGSNYFYYKNHQGSVTDIRDGSGGGVKTYKYDAFGNITDETGPSFNRGFTYTSRELHNRSGLYYYRARFYDPELGRFITQDPIGYLGGVNLYAYVGNDPINRVDALGLLNPEDDIST